MKVGPCRAKCAHGALDKIATVSESRSTLGVASRFYSVFEAGVASVFRQRNPPYLPNIPRSDPRPHSALHVHQASGSPPTLKQAPVDVELGQVQRRLEEELDALRPQHRIQVVLFSSASHVVPAREFALSKTPTSGGGCAKTPNQNGQLRRVTALRTSPPCAC